MFQLIGKSLLALIATLMVVDPVMACCLSGPLESVSAVAESPEVDSPPPCHGSRSTDVVPQKTAESSSVTAPAKSTCPSCGMTNCDTLMSAEVTKQLVLLNVTISEFEVAPLSSTRLNLNPVPAATELLIPQGPPPRAALTPISLRQRLLI